MNAKTPSHHDATLRALNLAYHDTVYLAADHGSICASCASANRRLILRSTRCQSSRQWTVVGTYSTLDLESPVECAHCGKQLFVEDAA